MEYDLGLNAGHIIEWFKEELRSDKPARFDVYASRTFVAEPVTDPAARVDKDEELAVMSAVGIFEVQPIQPGEGHWLLRIRVEDVVGSHLPDQGSVSDEVEEITIEAFESTFIAPGSGTIFVTLEAETTNDKERFDQIVADLLTDRHRG